MSNPNYDEMWDAKQSHDEPRFHAAFNQEMADRTTTGNARVATYVRQNILTGSFDAGVAKSLYLGEPK